MRPLSPALGQAAPTPAVGEPPMGGAGFESLGPGRASGSFIFWLTGPGQVPAALGHPCSWAHRAETDSYPAGPVQMEGESRKAPGGYLRSQREEEMGPGVTPAPDRGARPACASAWGDPAWGWQGQQERVNILGPLGPGSTLRGLAGPQLRRIYLQRPPHSPEGQGLRPAPALPAVPEEVPLPGPQGAVVMGMPGLPSCLLSNGTPRPVAMETASTQQSVARTGFPALS